MALTDNNGFIPKAVLPSGNGLAPERLQNRLGPSSQQALERLPQIHAEIFETADLARFLRSAVAGAAALMLLGALAVTFAGGATLQQEFAWALLVLAGVGAMLHSYIKSVARAFDRVPLREAAKDLRAVLFYAGFAWGAGAFLLLGNDPVPITGLCFAVLPSILLVPLIKDRPACLGFIVPVTVLTAAAIVLEPWSDAVVSLAMLLIVQGSIGLGLALPAKPRTSLPAGLSLR